MVRNPVLNHASDTKYEIVNKPLRVFFSLPGVSWVKGRINGEHVATDISHSAPVAAVAPIITYLTITTTVTRAKRKHRQYHTRATNGKPATPMNHIISSHRDPAAYKILRILLQLVYGQSPICIVPGRQIQRNWVISLIATRKHVNPLPSISQSVLCNVVFIWSM